VIRNGAALFAIDSGDRHRRHPLGHQVEKLREGGRLLGTDVKQILINRPRRQSRVGRSTCRVARQGPDAHSALLRVDGKGKIEEVSLRT